MTNISTIRISRATATKAFSDEPGITDQIDYMLEAIEMSMDDEAGVKVRTYANSHEITIEAPTNQLVDAANELARQKLI